MARAKTLWQRCAPQPIRTLGGEVQRLVESQQVVATMELTDTLAEHELLESILENSKPPLKATKKHYLLTTPFRYPPRQHGSRFGSEFEPSLFYAAYDTATVMAEGAYYRWRFWYDQVSPPPSGRYITEHTLFAVRYATEQGISLQKPPCQEYKKLLTHPSDYSQTQQLGADMRMADIQAFEYISARAADNALNVGIFTIDAIRQYKPKWTRNLICDTQALRVGFRFKESDASETFEFNCGPAFSLSWKIK